MNSRILKVIEECDVILLVLDARDVQGTRSRAVERVVREKGKELVYVVNKSDLGKGNAKLPGRTFVVSAKTRRGFRKLRHELRFLSQELNLERMSVGLIGYANVGKSSIISALKGRNVARVSSTAGFTRGEQWIALSPKICLLDTPGIIPKKESKEELVLKGSLDVTKVRDAVGAAMSLIQRVGSEPLKRTYAVEPFEDSYEQLEELAGKWNYLTKGAELDLDRTARRLLKDWQKGKLRP